ncbi:MULTISPECIES: endodeoxyribonuclease [unclassified Rhizobium]|uniref:endodeoxyribonuclease n=1 Tax=unclassified Rhizobium TaxID=2613769 RepID=UPI00115ED0ED|nr:MULTISPECIES: endodeoxyribonuclease [unclassified Rhizobium]TQX90254.1 endodeoxyribonuclease [Rhizobium sp. rho-13.1]TQY16204.1 endodeoxyribonuclease [Rhizobium sp. rho-1.1]
MSKTPTYRNKLESKVAATLPAEFQYETKRLPFQLTKHYLPDFVNESAKEILEVKGRFTAEDRQKHRAIAAQYPDWSVTIVFQNPDAKISKTSKTTYAAWCDANGIKWRRA